jgi:hypothetical protein
MTTIINDAQAIESQRQWAPPVASVYGFDDCFQGWPSGSGTWPRRLLCFQLQGERSVLVMTSNGTDGWNSLAYRAAIRRDVAVLVVVFSVDSPATARGLTLYEGAEELRTVWAQLDDSRATFVQRGEPIAGEDVGRYRKRRIQERLSNEYLLEICAANGVPMCDEPAWSGPGILLTEASSFGPESAPEPYP